MRPAFSYVDDEIWGLKINHLVGSSIPDLHVFVRS